MLELTFVELVVVFCNLVCILARSWNLDGARPVTVHVAESVGQVFELFLGEVSRLIQTHIEVNRSHASLSGQLWNKEEVKLFYSFAVFDQLVIDDATWWRVLYRSSISPSNKHSLVDSLVYNS